MTSELKKCTNCHGENLTWQFGNRVITGQQHNRLSLNDIEAYFFLACDDCSETLKMVTGDSVAEQMNTRAAQDVPELVRYMIHPLWGRMINRVGEYVLYSQAAEIIAAKDKEIEGQFTDAVNRMSDDCIALKANSAAKDARIKCLEAELDQAFGVINDRTSECKELAAKLAQYEAQEPVAWMHPKAGWVNVNKAEVANHCVFGISPVPLYASPAPAADLKAENERLRGALEFYADTSKYPSPLTGGMGVLWEDCGQIGRAALNVEASHDKV